MDFEIWTDKNGVQWKVAEMTTRQIKKTLTELKERLEKIMYSKIKKTDDIGMNMNMINYLVEWGGRFEMELERRKQNG